jgi:hypothetical protein
MCGLTDKDLAERIRSLLNEQQKQLPVTAAMLGELLKLVVKDADGAGVGPHKPILS